MFSSSTKLIHQSPKPQCIGVWKWVLWILFWLDEVMSVGLWSDGINALIKGDMRELVLSPFAM